MHHMKVFQLIMEDETDEKRKVMISWTAKDDFPSWIPTEGRARRSLKLTPLLGYHEWQGQKVLKFNKIHLLIPFLDATNGRARRSWNSTKFTCLSPSWMPRMAGPERYPNHSLVESSSSSFWSNWILDLLVLGPIPLLQPNWSERLG